MADQRDVIVRFIGEDRDLQRAFTNTEKRSKELDSRFSKLNKGLRGGLTGSGLGRSSLLFGSGTFLSTAGLTAVLSKSVDAASDLNEEITKSGQVFGDAGRAVDIWSKTTATAIGVSRLEALRATGTFGNLFNTVGLLPSKSAEMSRALTELAADLASFNNADISDVLLAIRSGLSGEAEPLRRYGVLLSETRVQQAAMAASGKTNAKELTNQEKALARYNIILDDTTVAQGDFARTSDGMANQTRIMKAQFADLSAELGNNLLPVVNKTIVGINNLFDAFSQAGDKFRPIEGLGDSIENIDTSKLIEVRDRLREIGDDGDRDIEVLSRLIALLQQAGPSRPDDRGGARGPGAIAASNRRAEQAAADRAAAEARADLERSRKRFAGFIKGLGLKLDKAGLTSSLNDDLSVLREIERAIQRQIKREGKTFALVQQLTDVRLEIARTVESQADEGKRAASNAVNATADIFESTIDALSLKVDVASATKGLADDRRALGALEKAILDQIKTEGKTNDLMRQLFDVRQEQAALRDRLREQQAEQQQRRQFRALGLTEEGEERGPSSRNLRRRLASLREQIEGTVLDTPKTQSQLDRIAKVLAGKFGKVGKEVRRAILEMFNDISSAFKEGDKKEGGQVTRGGIRSITNLIKGLGLTPEQEQALRDRARPRRRGTGAFGFEVNQPSTASTFTSSEREQLLEFNIFIDGKEVEAVVTRRQQKRGRRGAPARRGRAGGRNL